MAEHPEKNTRRAAKADTADLTEESAQVQRALTYRERQRLEAERNGTYRSYARPADAPRRQPRSAADGFDEPRGGEPAPAPKRRKKKKAKHSVAYRIACAVLILLIVLILLAGGALFWYYYAFDLNPASPIDHRDDIQNQYTQTVQTDNGPEVRVNVPIYEGEERYNLNAAIKEWKKQGDAYLQSNKVINILLAGIDRNEDVSDGRSDTMILASINLNTRSIILSSLYRDCWTYQTFADGSADWAKLNAAYVYGGAAGLISNVEDYFKIHIDHFAGVDFESFKKIIDILGGITVPVLEHEANYINKQTGYTANPCKAGDAVRLDGFQALWYVRMRHVDADEEISRTRRQRQFLTALIAEFKNTTLSELSGIINTFGEYVITDMTKTEILNYGVRAVTQRWYNYEIRQQQVPEEDYRMDFYEEGYFGSQWVWIVDYPGAAYEMQTNIYGYSNIVLNEHRRTMIDIWRYS